MIIIGNNNKYFDDCDGTDASFDANESEEHDQEVELYNDFKDFPANRVIIDINALRRNWKLIFCSMKNNSKFYNHLKI
jgi:hypothetical protein